MEASEITGTPSARQSAINAATNALKVSWVFLSGSEHHHARRVRYIVPITLTNHAPYTVMADVHLVTTRSRFPRAMTYPCP